MAKIRYRGTAGQDTPEREVPEDATATDRGIEWIDENRARHVVPWAAVLEFIESPGEEPRFVTPSVEKL